VADDIYTVEDCSEQRDEDEQAPSGAEAVFADEDLVESRRPRGWNWFGGCQHCVLISRQIVGLIVQGASSWWLEYIWREECGG